MARKFSKGLGGNNTKFGTIKGPITRIGQKVLKNDGNNLNDDTIYGVMKGEAQDNSFL